MSATAFLGLPWYIWGLLCLGVAAVYLVIWPRPPRKGNVPARPRWRQIVLRWFHSLVWLLLASACFVQAIHFAGSATIGPALALLAALTYVAFIGALVAELRMHR